MLFDCIRKADYTHAFRMLEHGTNTGRSFDTQCDTRVACVLYGACNTHVKGNLHGWSA